MPTSRIARATSPGSCDILTPRLSIRSALPQWLEIDPNERRGVVRSLPLREDIQIPVTEQLIVELYSK